jgi:Chlorite dismutase
MGREFTFVAGAAGVWRSLRHDAVIGPSLPSFSALSVHGALLTELPPDATWQLRGITSNERYVTRAEKTALVAKQPPLGRPEATRAALIPIRKSEVWWDLMQDERRAILEARTRHIELGLEYLPAIARRLHHSRDLGEPFDFLTWFEYAPENATAFEDLVAKLRTTEEWRYVDREVDIRLEREPS